MMVGGGAFLPQNAAPRPARTFAGGILASLIVSVSLLPLPAAWAQRMPEDLAPRARKVIQARCDPHADCGHHPFSYSYWLYPHGGDWKSAPTVHRGYEANYPLVAIQAEPHEGALLFRVDESAGKSSKAEIIVPTGTASTEATDLMEHSQLGERLALASDHVALTIRPFEIRTTQVNHPPAVPTQPASHP